jgi:hypothetical protein
MAQEKEKDEYFKSVTKVMYKDEEGYRNGFASSDIVSIEKNGLSIWIQTICRKLSVY